MTNISDLERAICCEGKPCISPDACYARDRSRSYPVRIHLAAKAVAALYCDQWRMTSQQRRATPIEGALDD